MPLLVRKITPAKWRQRKIFEGEPPSADAITFDMKTKDNALSAWEINSSGELNEAILAIVSAGTNLDRIDVVIIEHELLDAEGLNVVESRGKTPYENFAQRHRDIIKLDYDSLGKVAQAIIGSLKMNDSIRFTLSKLKEILKEGIKTEKIKLYDLDESIRNKIHC